jgi:hypothetical protein
MPVPKRILIIGPSGVGNAWPGDIGRISWPGTASRIFTRPARLTLPEGMLNRYPMSARSTNQYAPTTAITNETPRYSNLACLSRATQSSTGKATQIATA